MTAAIVAGPEVPQEVLSLWKSEPASVASPADIQDKITLKPNTASSSAQVSGDISLSVIPAGTWQDSASFYLKEGQWVDVIVSSLDIPIYFNWEEPGAISITANCWVEDSINLYKLLVYNLDPDKPHYLKYSISGAVEGLPISANVNLGRYGETAKFHNPEYSAATEGGIHASVAVSLPKGSMITLTLESDVPIDWQSNLESPGPQIGVLFAEMRTYSEEDGWITISSGSIKAKHVLSFNDGRRLEASLIIDPPKTRAGALIQKAQPVGQPRTREMSVFDPLYYKVLYENHTAITSTGTIFTTAGRMFASQGTTEYWFTFTNWNREKNADITYRVYKLGITPGWGKEFKEQKLQPWLNELYSLLVAKEITDGEYNLAETNWLEQFK
jgi:hypothetical protein